MPSHGPSDLSDDAAKYLENPAQFVPELLKLHRNTGHHPDGEWSPKILAQNRAAWFVLLLTGSQRCTSIDQEPGQSPWSTLTRKQVVVNDRECELNAAPGGGIENE